MDQYTIRARAAVELHIAQISNLLIGLAVSERPGSLKAGDFGKTLARMTEDRIAVVRDIASGAFADKVCPVTRTKLSSDHLLEFHQGFLRRATSVLNLVQAQALAENRKTRLKGSLARTSSVYRGEILRDARAFRPKVPDQAGRMWNPANLIELELRHAVLLAKVECRLIELSLGGEDVATVKHETRPDVNGLRFSITGATKDIPTYEDIKSSVFHPNSRAEVL